MARFLTVLAALALPLLLVLRGGEAMAMLAGRHTGESFAAAWLALLWPLALLAVRRRAPGVGRAWGRLDALTRLGCILVVSMALVAVLAPLVATHAPSHTDGDLALRYAAPSRDHWMGTDILGRDLFSRVVYGARVSLWIGLASVLASVLVGSVVGSVAGYAGGWVDGALMRFTDLMLAFPRLFLILAIISVYRPSVLLIVLVLGTTGWMSVARFIRGGVMQVRSQEYVEAARALGLPPARILLRHVLPAALGPVLVRAMLGIGNTILLESFLSFLGLGVQEPSISWGLLIRTGRDTLLSAWWLSTFPGLFIVLTVMGYNLLGDGLREAYDPRLRRSSGGATYA